MHCWKIPNLQFSPKCLDPNRQFHPWPFDKEAELESTIAEVKMALFGESRIYLDVKKLIGEKGRTQNIPDGYLLDLSSPRRPVLYLVEVELARHRPSGTSRSNS